MPKSSYLEKRQAERLALRKRNSTIATIAGVAVVAVVAFLIIRSLLGELAFTGEIDTIFPLSDNAKITRSGLVYDELIIGEGPEAQNGDTVSILYTGYLPNGQIFDSIAESGRTIEFVLGEGTVIKGWEEGILGMQAGGARLVVVPPDLTFGANDPYGIIPQDATLTYSITLKEIK